MSRADSTNKYFFFYGDFEKYFSKSTCTSITSSTPLPLSLWVLSEIILKEKLVVEDLKDELVGGDSRLVHTPVGLFSKYLCLSKIYVIQFNFPETLIRKKWKDYFNEGSLF